MHCLSVHVYRHVSVLIHVSSVILVRLPGIQNARIGKVFQHATHSPLTATVYWPPSESYLPQGNIGAHTHKYNTYTVSSYLILNLSIFRYYPVCETQAGREASDQYTIQHHVAKQQTHHSISSSDFPPQLRTMEGGLFVLA